MARSTLDDVVRDLRDEQSVLDDLLSSLAPGDWSRATPAEGWSIADTVRHLVVAERAATRSVRDGIDFSVSAEADVGPRPGGDLLSAWRDARTSTLDQLGLADPQQRVPWGGRSMRVQSLATARLMETWAHGLDCFAAMEQPAVDTDRLVHVAWLGYRTLPYAFARAGETPPAPPDRLRVELTAPSGATWKFGPERSRHRVLGAAGTWCRVVTRRLRPPGTDDLVATGALAIAARRVAQAYLDS